MVLDTSVALAWYLPETYAREARVWRDRFLAGQVKFVVPALHFWEMANVLRTYVRRGELADDLAAEIYETHLDAGLETMEPERWNVLRVALKYEATAYDAVTIALCLERELPLLTAEKTTTPWVVKLGKFSRTVEVPDLYGKSLLEANKILANNNLYLKIEGEDYDAVIVSGNIVRQDVPAGNKVKERRGIKVIISRGPRIKSVPRLTDETLVMLNPCCFRKG